MDDLKAFQLEEYRSLRKEIEIYIAEARTQERYSVIAAALTWAWLIVNQKTSGILWAVPFLPTALIAFREIAMRRHFSDMKGYIYLLEEAFCNKGPEPCTKGWEHYPRKWNVGLANIVLTVALFVVAVVAWLYRTDLVGAHGRT